MLTISPGANEEPLTRTASPGYPEEGERVMEGLTTPLTVETSPPAPQALGGTGAFSRSPL